MRVIGARYELRDEIGSGGMATVWSGWDTRLYRRVAVKLLARTLAADRTFVTRFEREAQLAARLSHPNVVAIFDYGTDDETPYIVMEEIEGQSLAARLHRGPLTQADTERVCQGVLAALDQAHRLGIVHRDIKPSNILLGSDGSVKVADFGIARVTSDATQLTDTGIMMGTIAYVSPEQCAGAPASPLSDLYGLGCVAYECLTGQPPFVGETSASVMYQHQQAFPRPVREAAPWVSAGTETVVLRALSKHPADRYQSAADMSHDLNGGSVIPRTTTPGVGAVTSGTVPLATTSSKGLKHRNRWRTVLWSVAAVIVLTGIAAGALYVAKGSSHTPIRHSAANGSPSKSATHANSAPTTSPGHPASSSTTTTSSGPIQASLTDISCPTSYAGPPSATSAPASKTALLPASLRGSFEFYSLNNGDLSVLAPAGWNCTGFVSIDGGSELAVVPRSAPLNSSQYGELALNASRDPTAVTATTTGACQGCAFNAVCAYLPNTANSDFLLYSQLAGCDSTIPPGETTGTLNPDVAYFEDPAGVRGAGDPSGGSNPANGIIVLQPPGPASDADVFSATCTLPDSEHAVCSAILNDYTQRYAVQEQPRRGAGSGGPSAQ